MKAMAHLLIKAVQNNWKQVLLHLRKIGTIAAGSELRNRHGSVVADAQYYERMKKTHLC